MARERSLEIPRRVHFFKMDAGRPDGKPVQIDVDLVLKEIEAIKLGEDRYLDFGEDQLMVIVDRAHPDHRVKLVRIRVRDVPFRILAGILDPMTLRSGEGIAEVTHLVFFPNQFIGVELNFNGPRASALPYYFTKVSKSCPHFRVRQLIRRDFTGALGRAGHIQLLDIRVRRAFIDKLSEIDTDLFEALRSARQLGDADDYELILRPKAHGRGTDLGQRVMTALRDLVGRDDLADGVETLQVKTVATPGHPSEAIDVLQEKMIFQETMMRLSPRTRAVSDESAYAAIARAWEANADEVQTASML